MYTPSWMFLRIIQSTHLYLSRFNTGVTIIKIIPHEELSFSLTFLSFTLLNGHCIYNSCLFMYFPILGAELITASCEHDLSFKWTSASGYWYPWRLIHPVDFIFFQNFVLVFRIYILNFTSWTVMITSISTKFLCYLFWDKLFGFHTRTITIKIFLPDRLIYILVIKPIPTANKIHKILSYNDKRYCWSMSSPKITFMEAYLKCIHNYSAISMF